MARLAAIVGLASALALLQLAAADHALCKYEM
jgi:hypothetical protein